MKSCFALTFLCLVFLAASHVSNKTDVTNIMTSCQITVDGLDFNLCLFNLDYPYTIPTFISSSLHFSMIEANVPSCNGSETIWGTFYTAAGGCIDVATENASLVFQDSQNPSLGGINITFPVTNSTGNAFQLVIKMDCLYYGGNVPMSMPDITYNGDGVTILTVSAPSSFGCSQPVGCPPTRIGDASYKICDFNNTFFTVPDPLGGNLTFTLGNSSQKQNCYNDQSDGTYSAQYQGSDCFPAGTNPSYQPLPYGEPQGLLITFGSTETTLGGYCCNVVNNQVQVKLYCDEDATDFAHTDFTLTTEVVSWDSSSYNLTHTAIGNSSLGCQVF